MKPCVLSQAHRREGAHPRDQPPGRWWVGLEIKSCHFKPILLSHHPIPVLKLVPRKGDAGGEPGPWWRSSGRAGGLYLRAELAFQKRWNRFNMTTCLRLSSVLVCAHRIPNLKRDLLYRSEITTSASHPSIDIPLRLRRRKRR